MPTVRLPLITDFQVNHFDTGIVDLRGSYMLNGTALKYGDDSWYVTQRPGFVIFGVPADFSKEVGESIIGLR